MPIQPPALSTPDRPVPAGEDRVLATTSQLAGRVEDALDCRLNAAVLEDLLLELDRGDFVEWVTVTRDGEYLWDLTDAPERIADVVAAIVVERLKQWLETRTDA
ncbi:hypothetical protein JMJ58_13105 [Haloterrigena salifodinae]|uniref:Uncharacterized protein n=1 Tax=Haloterrigena salifodinae TaxID=2675099 RepID=A0A8T8DWZ8_9EURY|nr:hypothetical protein [Haloterrigena salifodinae]QRV13887.1 hypothetical protein JMJ58_13105 [Haloterrigena salifodinae]